MQQNLSAASMKQYLPLIERVRADLEVRLLRDASELEIRNKLPFHSLWNDLPSMQVIQAWHIMEGWINGIGIQVESTGISYYFVKPDTDTRWSKLLELLTEKIDEYSTTTAAAAEKTKSSGHKTPINIQVVEDRDFIRGRYKFSLRARLRILLIKHLREAKNTYVQTNVLREAVNSKSEDSVRKAISAINGATKLHLKIQNLIKGHSGSGYRINPKYNLLLKK